MSPLLPLAVAVLLLQAPAAPAQGPPTYGPFTAIQIDRDVVEDVLVEGNDVYVKVGQKYWASEFKVKISNAKSDGYRTWGNGESEMAVKVYQSQQKNKRGFTYRVNTGAKYIEYWTEGKLVLHLERVKQRAERKTPPAGSPATLPSMCAVIRSPCAYLHPRR